MAAFGRLEILRMTSEPRLPSILMARPTVYDVLRDRIEQDPLIRPENREAIFLKSAQIIHERGLTQI